MLPRPSGRLRTIACLFALFLAVIAEVVPARRSCRRHFLAGQSKTQILPLRLNDGVQSNVLCEMPHTGGTEIVTVIQSGLYQSYQVREKKTVGFQIRDLDLLQDILRRNNCRQNVTIIWPPGFNNEKGIDLKVASVLNTVTTFSFSDAIANQIETILDGEAAGILHVFPQEPNSELAPTIQASEIRCIQRINPQPECLIDSDRGVEISFGASDEYFEFTFRTDHTAQSLFEVYMTENLVSHYRLENDFFMRIDGYPRNYVGMLADGRWHTVKFRISTRAVEIDGRYKFQPNLGLDEMKVIRLVVKVDGQVILTHPVDVANECMESDRLHKLGQNLRSREFCWDQPICTCKILSSIFDPLPSPACGHRENEEQQAYHLLRVPDLLSFLYLPDVLSPLSIKTAMTFRSDADSGLLMFGSWKEEEEWGRFQVHYHGEKMTAMYCTQSETFDEKCSACAVYRIGGFSSDNWSRVAFYKDLDSYYLMVDRELCELKLLTEENEFDTSEMYKTLLIRGSVLFIGGMFHKKVKPGIYKEDFRQKYFENTREKLPSLRGCVKDVFSNGHRVNLHEEFERQMTKTLVAPQKRSFGVMRGCGVCAVRCKGDARCRPMTSSRDPEFACDCADNYQYSNFGTCRKPRDGSLSLSATSLNAYRSIYTVPRNSGVLQRIWLKLRLPSVELKENTPLVMFYSYGRIIFRVFLDVYGSLNVQMNPEDPGVFTASAGKQIPKGDDRIHLVKLERRTPLGTHPSRRFFNLYIDGSKFSVQDPGLPLTSVEFALINVLNDKEAGCVTDFGAAYEYDEHNGGMVQQIDLKGLMMQDLGLSDGNDTCGAVDPRLWIYGPPESEPSVFGKIHDYTPNGRPEAALLLSPQWMIYSVLLTCFLVLLILLCLCLYCFLLKKGGKKIDDDDLYPDSKMSRHLIRRRSDEYPVIMRRPTLESNRDSYISDSLDNSDIRAYDDIRTHKVKIDRESMISFLDPVNEESRLAQARIVRRNVDENAPLVHIHDFEH
ncbi:unnamed protein product, partial [Mesorhabditis belari]|uniref:Laminin G domain-containing protein n=1 Tax=Mesorhabditis belari TaxID=2138241 RepID=A0AAF3EEC6_9BILA